MPWRNTEPGTPWPVQVVPPSVVRATACALPSPTASHTRTEGHASPVRSVNPAGLGWRVQVAPPSVVVTAVPTSLLPAWVTLRPTATQTVTDGHETAWRSCTLRGRRCGAQVVPPLVVRRASPVPPYPAASHVVTDGQAMP